VIRPGGPQDVPFMRDMLQHAYYWRVDRVSESGEPPLRRYVERWGRPGDTSLIAIQDFQRVGAAWYRLFTAANAGYGFIDEQTPELSIAIVPSRRGTGLGSELLSALLEQARADGHDAISLSVEDGSPAIGLYQRHGFEQVDEDDGGVTMRASLTADG
jgi:ribosomal protein S18 acetylase RimI-like enzyme